MSQFPVNYRITATWNYSNFEITATWNYRKFAVITILNFFFRFILQQIEITAKNCCNFNFFFVWNYSKKILIYLLKYAEFKPVNYRITATWNYSNFEITATWNYSKFAVISILKIFFRFISQQIDITAKNCCNFNFFFFEITAKKF